MSKVKAYMKKSLASILSERNILSNLHYSLIANLHFSFQDKEYLYLVLDYFPGGDLRYHLSKRFRFNESQIKFIISNLLLSLNYLHNNNIIHRDIKPENLVFDDRGYLHLTDFGIARRYKPKKSILDKSGTPGYISPEVLLNKPQRFCSDFFSVGVICYELLLNKKPFKGKNKKEIAEKILNKEIKLTKKNLPENYSLSFGDFINQLLKRNYRERLGNKSIEDIKNHPWLKGVEWEKIENKLITSENIPFSPSAGDNFDEYMANKKEYIDMEHYDEYLKKINDSGYFKNFYFNYLQIKHTKTMNDKTTNFSIKVTSPTEGAKTTQYEVLDENENKSDHSNLNLSLYKGISNNSFVNNDEQNKSENINNNERTNNFDIKGSPAFINKSKTFEKEKLKQFYRSNLFQNYDDDN